MKRKIDDVAAAYDKWAPIYDTDGNPLVALDDEIVPDMFPRDLENKEALDVGCGTGRHLVKLLLAGARAIGVDASPGMLRTARERAPGAKLIQHDVGAGVLPFADARFDFVLCTLVLEHVQDLAPPIAEIARVMKPGARALISDIHPSMRERGTQANFTDPDTGDDVLPPSFPHAVADYARAAERAGLHVDEVEEHAGTPELVKATLRAARYVGWPMLVTLRLSRPGAR